MNKVIFFLIAWSVISPALGATWDAEAYNDTSGTSSLWTNLGRYAFHEGSVNNGTLYAPLGWAKYNLPADFNDATVTSATIEYDVFGVEDDSMGFYVYGMTSDWTEGNNDPCSGACYMSYNGTNYWPSASGWGTADVMAGIECDSGVLTPRANNYSNYDTYNVDITEIAQAWADGDDNYGVLMIPYDDGSGWNWIDIGMDNSAQGGGAYIPHGTILHLDYIPHHIEASKDASGHSGTWTNLGRYAFHEGAVSSGGIYQPLGWAAYDLPVDFNGAKDVNATIEYDVFGAADTDMGFYVYGMMADWVEGNNDPCSGACYMSPDGNNAWPNANGWGMSDIMSGVSGDSGILAYRSNNYSEYDTYTVDITAIAQRWASGYLNRGVLLMPYDDGSVGMHYLDIGMDTTAQGGGAYIPHGTILHLDYTPATPVSGKLIEMGWDFVDPNYLHDNIATLEQTAFDGVMIDAVTDSGDRMGCSVTDGYHSWFDKTLSLDINDFSEMIDTINDTDFTRFTDNFIHVMMVIDMNTLTWYDSNACWDAQIVKCETISQICAEANNFAGIFLDTEQYGTGSSAPWLFDYSAYSSYGDYNSVKAKVRSRARDIAEALCSHRTDMIILLPGAYEVLADRVIYHSELVGYDVPAQNTYQALYPAFIDGLLEGLSAQAQAININQAGYAYMCSDKFNAKKAYCEQAITDYADVNSTLLARLKIGFSTWIDYSSDLEWPTKLDVDDFSNNHFSPINFRKAVYNGLVTADSEYYVVNAERTHWWTPGNTEAGDDAGPYYRGALSVAKCEPDDSNTPDRINDTNIPAAASAYSGWDDANTFGDLWDDYDELYDFPKQWDFYQDTQDIGRYEGLCGVTQIKHTGWWSDVNISEWWERQGSYAYYNGIGWYRSEFTLTSGNLSKTLYLAFGAVADDAMVYVNGVYIARNATGERFLAPLGSYGRVGTNSVAVRVLNKEGPGGIWKSVKLIANNTGPATGPSPTNGATNVSITADLSWTAGSGANSHNVYFGTDSTPDETEYKGNQAGTTYDTGTMSAGTTYYWRIDEVGPGGTTTGDVWSFTTIPNPPTFIAVGAVTHNTEGITPALPASIATNDILLLFVETYNQAISITNQNGGTWTQVTGSPQGTTGTRLTAFWSRYNGTQGVPTTSDSGNHQVGVIIAIRGATISGNPWDVAGGGVESTSDTSGSIPGATTTVPNTLVITTIATSLPDYNYDNNRFSNWANDNLTSLTERVDCSRNSGNGGGLGIATGVKATVGAYGNTAVTLATAATKGMMSIAIKP